MAKPREHLTDNEIEFYKNLILKKREKLLEEINYLKESSLQRSIPDYSGKPSTYSFHMADQGTDAQEREKAFLFASREGKFLNHLERALDRIADGTYGYCQKCGKLISRERLKAVPHATMCISCKTKLQG